jgi:hypothetical protein
MTKHRDIYVKVRDNHETMYTDQTGAFPVQSIKGNGYTMIFCKIDNKITISEAT